MCLNGFNKHPLYKIYFFLLNILILHFIRTSWNRFINALSTGSILQVMLSRKEVCMKRQTPEAEVRAASRQVMAI